MTFKCERFFPELAGRLLDPLDYFHATWQMRGALFEQWIDEGETNLPRLLSRFVNLEKRYAITGDMADGVLTGNLRYYPLNKGRPFDPLERLETRLRGVSCSQDAELSPHIHFDVTGMLVELAEGADTIVELGSGYGLQLFRMFYGGAPGAARYVGSEISAAGRDLATRLAILEPGMRFESTAFDLRSPDWSVLADSRKAMIFSAWSLMYVDRLADDFFTKLAQWPGEATLVFCEPIGFQWGITHDLSEKQAQAAEVGRLNANMARAIANAASAGLIEPLVVAKDVFAAENEPFDLMTVIVCHKPAG